MIVVVIVTGLMAALTLLPVVLSLVLPNDRATAGSAAVAAAAVEEEAEPEERTAKTKTGNQPGTPI